VTGTKSAASANAIGGPIMGLGIVLVAFLCSCEGKRKLITVKIPLLFNIDIVI